MMPPPTTPTPRKFLPAQPQTSKTSARGLKQLPKHDQIRGADDLMLRGDASDQFGLTPRFTSAASRQIRPHQESVHVKTETTPSRPPSVLFSSIAPQSEDVLDRTQSDGEDDEAMLLDDEASGWSDELTLSPKRRKISTQSQDTAIPIPQLFAKPGQPASTNTVEPSKLRFVSSITPTSQSRSTQPRSFVTGTNPRDELHKIPLPDAFSPHRRGERYIAGGMAATMQDWILQTAQVAVQARRQSAEYIMQVKIIEILLDKEIAQLRGVVQDDGREVNLILISESRRNTPHCPALSVTAIVGLKEPCWPLTIHGLHFIVCVEWKII